MKNVRISGSYDIGRNSYAVRMDLFNGRTFEQVGVEFEMSSAITKSNYIKGKKLAEKALKKYMREKKWNSGELRRLPDVHGWQRPAWMA